MHNFVGHPKHCYFGSYILVGAFFLGNPLIATQTYSYIPSLPSKIIGIPHYYIKFSIPSLPSQLYGQPLFPALPSIYIICPLYCHCWVQNDVTRDPRYKVFLPLPNSSTSSSWPYADTTTLHRVINDPLTLALHLHHQHVACKIEVVAGATACDEVGGAHVRGQQLGRSEADRARVQGSGGEDSVRGMG